MTDIITSIGTAINIVKELKSFNDKLKDSHFSNMIADLNLELAELKLKLADVLTENSNLKIEINNLKSKNTPTHSLTYTNGAYYNDNQEGPFCPGCYDLKKSIIRLTNLPIGMRDFGNFQCPICKSIFNVKQHATAHNESVEKPPKM
jgi:hypothetical protein